MDGARVQKKSGGKPGPAVWVPAAILAVLLAAYLGLCGWVSASDTILPNVTAACRARTGALRRHLSLIPPLYSRSRRSRQGG